MSFRHVDYLLLCLRRAARLLPALLVYISLLGDVHVLNLWIPGRCKAYGNNIELTNLALGLEITPTRDRATERLLILTLRSHRHASTVRCRLLGLHVVPGNRIRGYRSTIYSVYNSVWWKPLAVRAVWRISHCSIRPTVKLTSNGYTDIAEIM